MSLEELLKTPASFSTWSEQRRKLFRVCAGLLVAAVGLIVGALMLNLIRAGHAAAPKLVDPPTPPAQDSEALTELMRLQKQTAEMSRELAVGTNAAGFGPGTAPRRARAGTNVRIINYDPGEGFANLASAKTDVYIPTGSVFQAELLTPIKTSVERTFVMAETTNEFRMDMKRRIPRGSRLIGRSHFDPVLKGVVVEFETLVTPDGIETSLTGLALSRNALPMIDGLYFSDKMTHYGTAIAFGFLSGFSNAARERDYTLLGSQPRVTMGNQVLSGLSIASFQVANEILRDIRSRAIEYVVVPAGEPVFVVLTRRYQISQGGPS